MSIYLGNLQFEDIRKRTGYQLNDDDRVLWDKYHNDDASLDGMENCFHVFDIPLCIHIKGEEAKQAIMKMFSSDKLEEAKGTFQVYMK